MIKNVVNPISLLLLVLILAMSSCSSSKKYAYNSSKKSRTERKPRTERKSKTSERVKSNKTTTTSNNTKRSQIVSTAKKYIGKSYVYGGKKPSTGFDCSGFTAHVYKNNGISLSGPSHHQAKQGKRKSMRELKEGDLVFFGKKNKVSHVAIVTNVEHNRIKVIHSTSSRGVVIDDISSSDYWKKRYLFGRDVLN